MKKISGLALVAAAATASTFLSSSATASEGYFQTAFGARHSGLAGAGLAFIKDSTGLGLNPAGIVGLERQLNIGLKLFSPRRYVIGSGEPGLSPLGKVDSEENYFLIPNFSYVQPLGEKGALGVGLFANGGMNTSYPAVERDMMECGGGSGVFCGGEAGVDLMQAFATVGYAHRVTDRLSVGVTAMLAIQRFKAEGLIALSGFSSDPSNFTNNQHALSTGLGVKVGVTYDAGPVSVAATYQPKINMSPFKRYRGLFEGGGDFDIPESYSVGLALKASETVTLVADYRRINYSDVGSVGNSSQIPLPFGSDGGPGFGWSDVNSYKVGLEVDVTESFTARLGYALNDNPISSADVNLNILAPGVVREHYAVGFSYQLTQQSKLNFSALYVPDHQVTGAGLVNPNHEVTIGMKQYMTTVGWSYSF